MRFLNIPCSWRDGIQKIAPAAESGADADMEFCFCVIFTSRFAVTVV